LIAADAKSLGILVAQDAGGLKEIWRPAYNLAIWPRAPFAGEAALRAALRAGVALSIEADLDVSRSLRGLDALLPDAVLNPAFSAAWRKDVLDLVVLYAGLGQTASVRLRLETVRGAACRLFHADYVSLRLLCTYAGRGTEYLDESNADRTGLGQGRNTKVVRDRKQVRRLAANHVGLFKGDAYPGNAGRGVIHRSPPANARMSRLVLCLDAGES
jgi:Protein of unknown function (DUF1826)